MLMDKWNGPKNMYFVYANPGFPSDKNKPENYVQSHAPAKYTKSKPRIF